MGTPLSLAVTVTGVASWRPPGSSTSSGIPLKTSRNWDGTNMVLSTSADTRQRADERVERARP